MKKLFLLFATLVITLTSQSQSIEGLWKTLDPFTNKPAAIVKTYIVKDKLYGQIVTVFDREDPENALCEECPGQWKNKPIKGLVVLDGLEKDGDKWTGNDKFFSRATKKTYSGAVWMEGDNLKIQLQLGLVKYSRKWQRLSANEIKTFGIHESN